MRIAERKKNAERKKTRKKKRKSEKKARNQTETGEKKLPRKNNCAEFGKKKKKSAIRRKKSRIKKSRKIEQAIGAKQAKKVDIVWLHGVLFCGFLPSLAWTAEAESGQESAPGVAGECVHETTTAKFPIGKIFEFRRGCRAPTAKNAARDNKHLIR